MEGSNDRRRKPRAELGRPLEVCHRETGELLGTVVNITTQGILLLSEAPLEVPQTYACKMKLPEEQFLTRELIFDARTVWSEVGSTAGQHRTGLQLTNVSSEERSMIELVIREFTGMLA